MLELDPAKLREFQQIVIHRVRAAEQAQLDAAYREAQQAYQVKLATYENDIEQLKRLVISDLLTGASEQENRATMLTELKRLCLTQLTRQMDLDPADDTWSTYDALATRDVNATFHKFTVTEGKGRNPVTQATFEKTTTPIPMRLPRLTRQTREKGGMIQFLNRRSSGS